MICYRIKLDLHIPGGENHLAFLLGIGREQNTAVYQRHILQNRHLIYRQIGLIGNPDCPVLHRVDSVLGFYGIIINATVLPRWVMGATHWRPFTKGNDQIIIVLVGKKLMPGKANTSHVWLKQTIYKQPKQTQRNDGDRHPKAKLLDALLILKLQATRFAAVWVRVAVNRTLAHSGYYPRNWALYQPRQPTSREF